MNKITAGIIVAVLATGSIAFIVLRNIRNNETRETDSTTSQPAVTRDDTAGDQTENVNAEILDTDQITYKNFDVLEKTIIVKKGTTVTWTNEDVAAHDVVPDTETTDFKASQLFGKGETYRVTFNTPGTYTYYCSPHPFMKGSIEVVE